ncbi:MAG: hypothetical protein ACKVS8_12950 [Phycisphaerales bacterium]
MASYPTSPRADFLAWAINHAPVFDAQEGNIGLSAQQVAAFQSALTAAQGTSVAFDNAKDIVAATADQNTAAFAALKKQASTCVRNIKNFAEDTNNPNVYALAQIPPPADPSTIAPPAKPTGMTVELDPSNGAITLRWKASNPKGAAGTSYIVRRRLPADPAGQFQFIGVTGVKKYTDNDFTAGPDAVQYTIQGQRSDKAGPLSDIFTISFGRNSQGQQTAFVANENQQVRLAA